MVVDDLWVKYHLWCKHNKCANEKCICCNHFICEDIRGVEGCYNYKPLRENSDKENEIGKSAIIKEMNGGK